MTPQKIPLPPGNDSPTTAARATSRMRPMACAPATTESTGARRAPRPPLKSPAPHVAAEARPREAAVRLDPAVNGTPNAWRGTGLSRGAALLEERAWVAHRHLGDGSIADAALAQHWEEVERDVCHPPGGRKLVDHLLPGPVEVAAGV